MAEREVTAEVETSVIVNYIALCPVCSTRLVLVDGRSTPTNESRCVHFRRFDYQRRVFVCAGPGQ